MKESAKKYSLQSAFTMLELVFVIVIVGILSASIIPRMSSEPLYEAAIQLVSHIRYTQHLALNDDKYDWELNTANNEADWYQARWQLIFSKSVSTDGEYSYTIFSDASGKKTGNPDYTSLEQTEIARDPANAKKLLSGGFSSTFNWKNHYANTNLNIGKTYGVIDLKLSGGCSNSRISFDHLGRPMRGDWAYQSSPYGALSYRRLIKYNTPCIITLKDTEDIVKIQILPESGYTCILDNFGKCIKH